VHDGDEDRREGTRSRRCWLGRVRKQRRDALTSKIAQIWAIDETSDRAAAAKGGIAIKGR
jgi:hypothetical protein